MTALAGDDDTDANGEGIPDETWLNADIRQWASDHSIDLGGATVKAAMLTVIREALSD